MVIRWPLVRLARALAAVPPLLLAAGCADLLPAAPDPAQELVGMVDGLSAAQRAQHLRGDAEFSRIFAAADGLGPVFVAPSCESCHVGDGKGHPLFRITRFGRSTPQGFDPMPGDGGPQLQDRAVAGYEPERLPTSATGVARLVAPAVTGLGLLDAVDDSTLIRLADPNDADRDGISGRLQLLEPTPLHEAAIALERAEHGAITTRGTLVNGRYIGRFGKKALSVNLLQQVVGAYHEDMGITSDLIPTEIFNPHVGAFSGDAAPEPEVPQSVVNAVLFYMKTLKVPPRRQPNDPQVTAGEALFSQGGCAKCHVPTLRTGASTIAALHQQEFHPYTDLLLHDMGPELDDGYTEGSATSAEWRTPPLWGLGLAARAQGGTMRLLHDGRATSIEEAIRFHGGEGARSRAWFDALNAEQRRQLLAYLMSL
jgi:CxxC motif-containing protein (DUF1111 family)